MFAPDYTYSEKYKGVSRRKRYYNEISFVCMCVCVCPNEKQRETFWLLKRRHCRRRLMETGKSKNVCQKKKKHAHIKPQERERVRETRRVSPFVFIRNSRAPPAPAQSHLLNRYITLATLHPLIIYVQRRYNNATRPVYRQHKNNIYTLPAVARWVMYT